MNSKVYQGVFSFDSSRNGFPANLESESGGHANLDAEFKAHYSIHLSKEVFQVLEMLKTTVFE